MENFGGRKFIFGMTLVIAGFVLVLMDKTSAEAYYTFSAIVGATYIAGNVTQKATEKLE